MLGSRGNDSSFFRVSRILHGWNAISTRSPGYFQSEPWHHRNNTAKQPLSLLPILVLTRPPTKKDLHFGGHRRNLGSPLLLSISLCCLFVFRSFCWINPNYRILLLSCALLVFGNNDAALCSKCFAIQRPKRRWASLKR